MMRSAFGQITQIAFVTRDIDASVRHFVNHLGIGPWFMLPPGQMRPRDCPDAASADLLVGFSHARGIEFELIQQTNETPSIWKILSDDTSQRDFFHHTCIWPDDYDAAVLAALDANYQSAFDGETPRGRFTYMTHAEHAGSYFEICEVSPLRQAMQAAIREGAQNWDGGGPMRAMPPI